MTRSWRRRRRSPALLRDLGVGEGDRVILYMPMVPEAVIAMLACARLGAIHSVVFGGFAPRGLRPASTTPTRRSSSPHPAASSRAAIVAYKPLLDQAIALSRREARSLPDPAASAGAGAALGQAATTTGRKLRDRAPIQARSAHDCVPAAAADPLYILYTSGTTGRPKGVVRDNGGHMVALIWSMRNIYAIDPGDVFWAASDVGWVVGHSYIVYAPLLPAAPRFSTKANR